MGRNAVWFSSRILSSSHPGFPLVTKIGRVALTFDRVSLFGDM